MSNTEWGPRPQPLPGWWTVIRSRAARRAGDVAIAVATLVFAVGMAEVGLALMHLR